MRCCNSGDCGILPNWSCDMMTQSYIYSAMYIGIMLVVDLLYGIIDPRIRLAKGDD